MHFLRLAKLHIFSHTIVVRFGSRLAHWIAARVAEVVALVNDYLNAPDMHIWRHVRRVVAQKKDIAAPPEESV